MKTNPLPNHGGPVVSAVIEEETTEPVKWVDNVKTLLSTVLKRHEQFGFLTGIHEDCTICESDP